MTTRDASTGRTRSRLHPRRPRWLHRAALRRGHARRDREWCRGQRADPAQPLRVEGGAARRRHRDARRRGRRPARPGRTRRRRRRGRLAPAALRGDGRRQLALRRRRRDRSGAGRVRSPVRAPDTVPGSNEIFGEFLPAEPPISGRAPSRRCTRRPTSARGSSCAATSACTAPSRRRIVLRRLDRQPARRERLMRYLLAVWDGGGATPPNLGIARLLVERGHEVVVVGDPTLAEAIAATGASHRTWPTAPQRASTALEDDLLQGLGGPHARSAPSTASARASITGPAARFAADVGRRPRCRALRCGARRRRAARRARRRRGARHPDRGARRHRLPRALARAPAAGPRTRARRGARSAALRDRAGYAFSNLMWDSACAT